MTYQWFQREMALFVSAALALISAGCSAGAQMPVGNQTLGRIWNVMGEPVDGKPMPEV